MISHLQKHIKKQEKIECPFFNCSLVFQKRSSISAHLSRKLKPYKESDNVERNTFEHFENSEVFDNLLENSKISPQSVNPSLALFYLRLKSKFHLPSSVIDLIIAAIISLHELIECISKELIKIDINESARNNVLKSIESNDLLSVISSNQSLLKSNYLRNAYLKKKNSVMLNQLAFF